MARVQVQGMVKRYGTLDVVHGIDLDIAKHEFLVLVGPSGCGKSTTLRMIAGLEEISDGQLIIDGKVMNHVAPKDRDVAMVFQNYALYPHLNVAQNIGFGLSIRGTPKSEIVRQVADVAKTLGLTEYLERRPTDLSGGQRQRVAMGRAIVRHPKVFLFDEPLSNLDAKLRTQMRAEIKRLHRRIGVTSIYVTHDQVEAMTLADRIVVMKAGRIEQIGTPMELFMDPVNTFVAGFLGAPPMNQVAAVVANGTHGPVARIGNQSIDLPPLAQLRQAEGRRVIVGIRPEFAKPTVGEGPGHVAVSVDLVEPLGSEALLHATLAGAPFIMKADTLSGLEELDRVDGFKVDTNLLRIFDGDTGQAFAHKGVAA